MIKLDKKDLSKTWHSSDAAVKGAQKMLQQLSNVAVEGELTIKPAECDNTKVFVIAYKDHLYGPVGQIQMDPTSPNYKEPINIQAGALMSSQYEVARRLLAMSQKMAKFAQVDDGSTPAQTDLPNKPPFKVRYVGSSQKLEGEQENNELVLDLENITRGVGDTPEDCFGVIDAFCEAYPSFTAQDFAVEDSVGKSVAQPAKGEQLYLF